MKKLIWSSATFMAFLIVMLPVCLSQNLNLNYDANGNLISGDGFFRVYNSLNQLSKIYKGNSTSGNLTEEYTFHPVEERVLIKKVYNATGGLKETVYYVSDEFVRVVNASGTYDTTYVKHEGQLIAELKPNGNKTFYHPDHLGSTTLITNQSGNVIDNLSTTPYGSILSSKNTSRYSYTGQEYDSVVGDYDYHARRYNSNWGKFVAPDKLISNTYEPQDLNHYSYVHNNPYKFYDPNGKDLVVVNQPYGADYAGHTYSIIGNENTGYVRVEMAGKEGVLPSDSRLEISAPRADFNSFIRKGENYMVYKTSISQDNLMYKFAKYLKDSKLPYILGAYDCDTSTSLIAYAGGVPYSYKSVIPTINFVRNIINNIVNNIIYEMRASQSSKAVFGDSTKRSGYSEIVGGYVTEKGETYPTNNPNWSPNPNAPRYTPPKNEKY